MLDISPSRFQIRLKEEVTASLSLVLLRIELLFRAAIEEFSPRGIKTISPNVSVSSLNIGEK